MFLLVRPDEKNNRRVKLAETFAKYKIQLNRSPDEKDISRQEIFPLFQKIAKSAFPKGPPCDVAERHFVDPARIDFP